MQHLSHLVIKSREASGGFLHWKVCKLNLIRTQRPPSFWPLPAALAPHAGAVVALSASVRWMDCSHQASWWTGGLPPPASCWHYTQDMSWQMQRWVMSWSSKPQRRQYFLLFPDWATSLHNLNLMESCQQLQEFLICPFCCFVVRIVRFRMFEVSISTNYFIIRQFNPNILPRIFFPKVLPLLWQFFFEYPRWCHLNHSQGYQFRNLCWGPSAHSTSLIINWTAG